MHVGTSLSRKLHVQVNRENRECEWRHAHRLCCTGANEKAYTRTFSLTHGASVNFNVKAMGVPTKLLGGSSEAKDGSGL